MTQSAHLAAGNPARRYDWVGNVIEQIDANGRRTETQYDDRHRATTVIEAVALPEQRTSTTLYDPNGNVFSATRPRTYDSEATQVDITTSYGYDPLNRATTMIEAFGTPLARTATTVFDNEGNVLSYPSGERTLRGLVGCSAKRRALPWRDRSGAIRRRNGIGGGC